MKLKITPKACSWAIILAGAAIVWAMCMRAVWIFDDMEYAYILTDDYIPMIRHWGNDAVPRHIESFKDIIDSQIVHWHNVNGRAVAHTIIQWFCGIGGRALFAICDAAVFVAFVILVLWHSRSKIQNVRSVATIVLLYFISFVTYMTPAFQICCMWMFTLALLWLRFLFDGRRRPAWTWPLLFLLGLFAGCGNEALNVGLSVAIFLWWLGRVRSVNLQQYVLIIGFALGCALLVFSPGNFARVGRKMVYPSFIAYFLTLINFLGYTLSFLLPLLAIVVWQILRRQSTLKKIYTENSFWIITLVLCLALGVVLGSWANRLFLGAALAAVVLIIRILPRHGFNSFWLACLIAYASFILYENRDYIEFQRHEYNRIRTDFINNGGGLVCTSVPHEHMLFFQEYSNTIPLVGDKHWRACLRSEFPDYKPLELIPEVLPAMNDTVVYPYTRQLHEDMWICVRPKGDNCEFISHHSIGIGGIRRKYKSTPVSMDADLIDGGTWEAVLLPSAYMWRTLGIDSVTVVQNR